VVEPSTLRRQFAGTLAELTIAKELDGDIEGFGKRFWTAALAKVPDVRSRLEGGLTLRGIRYVDRYLQAPLSLRLLRELVAGLATYSGAVSPDTKLEVRTSRLGSQQGRGDPWQIGHDWRYEDDRRAVAESVLPVSGGPTTFTVSRVQEMSHARELLLEWDDGATWLLRLDHGLGFWVADRRQRFPFDRNPDAQIRAIQGPGFPVAGRAPEHPTIIYIGGLAPA